MTDKTPITQDLFDVPNTDPVIPDEPAKPKKLSKYEKLQLASRLQNKPTGKKADIVAVPVTTVVDKIPRILTDIRPSDMMSNYVPKMTLQQVKDTGKLKIITETPNIDIDKFMQDGSRVELATPEQRTLATDFLQKWKLSSYSAVWTDFCGGIYKLMTTGNQNNFVDFKPVTYKSKDGTQDVLYKWVVKATLPQIKKCCFGGLVDNDGEFKWGYGDLLNHTSYKDLIDIFVKQKAEPALLAFKAEQKDIAGNVIEPAVYRQYTPLHIAKIENGIFTIELDPFYFPFKLDDNANNDRIIADARFLPNIAGCYSVCIVGHNILSNENRTSNIPVPKATTINRYYSAMQGAWNFQNMLGIHLENKNQRENIRVNKQGIIDLFCGNVWEQNGRLKGDFNAVRESAAMCGEAMYQGLKQTGLLTELANLPNADKIHIPARDKAVQYIPEYDKALIVKADSISKFK